MTRAIVVLLMVVAGPASAQRGWRWRADERVIVGDFSVVQSVAASRDAMFAATTNGLIGYDRRFRKWQTPFTPADGYETDPVVSAAVDPADQTLWLGTRAGLLQYRLPTRQLEAIPFVGGVGELFFDRDDPLAGVFFSTRFGWRQLARGQVVPQDVPGPPPPARRITTPSVAEILRRFPVAEAMAPTTLLDAQLRSYRFTSAAVTPDADDVYFGTDGLGVLRLDAFTSRFERLPFGLLSQAAGAVAADSVVWTGTGGGVGRSGVTAVDSDVQRFEYHESRAGGFRSVRDLLVRGAEVWGATDRGVAVLQRDGTWRAVDRVSGLPSDNALALADAPSGVWVGTDRGLAHVGVDDSVSGVPVVLAVLSLLHTRDTLWIGTTRGLMVRPGEGPDLLVPRDGGSEPSLRDPVVALTALGDTILAATGERLIWRVPGRGWVGLPVISPQLGTLRALAADSGGVWVGGERGLGFYRFAGKDLTTFRVPDDVPGPVQDLAVRGRFLWVATPEGLVRFDRRALRL